MTNRREWFETFQPINKGEMAITLGNGQVVYVAGHGNIRVESIIRGKKFENILTNALYVPDISKNLFSIGSVTAKEIEAKIIKDTLTLYLNGQVRLLEDGSLISYMQWTGL